MASAAVAGASTRLATGPPHSRLAPFFSAIRRSRASPPDLIAGPFGWRKARTTDENPAVSSCFPAETGNLLNMKRTFILALAPSKGVEDHVGWLTEGALVTRTSVLVLSMVLAATFAGCSDDAGTPGGEVSPSVTRDDDPNATGSRPGTGVD